MNTSTHQPNSIVSNSLVSRQNFNTYKLFGNPRTDNGYLYNKTSLTGIPSDGNITIPMNIDTEFVSLVVHWLKDTCKSRKGVTTQMRGIAMDEGVILAHKGVSEVLKRFKVAQSDFHPIDYLKHLGYNVTLEYLPGSEMKGLNTCEFVLYAHFALAEAMMIVDGEMKEQFKGLMKEKSKKEPRFEMTRRLRTVRQVGRGTYNREADSVLLDAVIHFHDFGKKYRLSVSIQDTGAVHGVASYKDLCSSVGIILTDKDNLTKKDKKNIMKVAVDRPDDFDGYALGDLYPYDALENNAKKFREIYSLLGIEDYYQPPRLTIGATIRDLFQAVLLNHLGINPDDKKEKYELLEKFQRPASAGSLKQNPTLTRSLSSKVQGGRCRNNRSTVIKLEGAIVDLDLSGAYSEAQRSQLYPLGVPEILDFEANSENNEYWTLRQFLKEYGDDLVDGLWFARVSTSEPLKCVQDISASWFIDSVGEDILKMSKYAAIEKSDTEKQGVEFEVDEGELKILNHEILNGTVTYNFIEWLDYVATSKLKKELLDKLLVKSAMVYPKSWRVNSFEELKKNYKSHKDKNKINRIGRGKHKKLRKVDGECHAWYAVNLGELLIDDLAANRKIAQKVHGKKSPLDVLFKLCNNTLYGDMTSKFFDSANVVVGNQITDNCRFAVWYMEKGLYGVEPITDGCAFDLNKVVYPIDESRRLNGENVVNLYREKDERSIRLNRALKLAPLGGYDRIDLDWIPYTVSKKVGEEVYEKTTSYAPSLKLIKGDVIEELKPVIVEIEPPKAKVDGEQVVISTPSIQWVNRVAMEHLQKVFPNVSVLHKPTNSLKPELGDDGKPVKNYVPRVGMFEFEMKDFYNLGVFHGSANYLFENPNGQVVKMRAYETKKEHESVSLKNGELLITDRYGESNNPAKDFLNQLKHPESVVRQSVFVKDAILKPSDYKHSCDKWDEMMLDPGDSFYKCGLLREFSLSQFTFKTFEQYISWKKVINRAKNKFGQSIERFFINEDNTLNYSLMIETVDKMIDEGVLHPFEHLDKHRNIGRRENLNHPQLETLLQVKNKLLTPDEVTMYDWREQNIDD